MKRVRKNRYNLTLPPDLHAWAKAQADKEGTSLSDYVAGLLEQAHSKEAGEVKLTRDERVALRREISEEVLGALLRQKRGG